MSVGSDHIICDNCNFRFERTSEYKHCSNCFACTGCEIYYCPECDFEIIVKPVKKMPTQSSDKDSDSDND